MPTSYNAVEATVRYSAGQLPAPSFRGQKSFRLNVPRTEDLNVLRERIKKLAQERIAKDRKMLPSTISIDEIEIA